MASDTCATRAASYARAARAAVTAVRSRMMACIAGRPCQVVRTEVTSTVEIEPSRARMRTSAGLLMAPS